MQRAVPPRRIPKGPVRVPEFNEGYTLAIHFLTEREQDGMIGLTIRPVICRTHHINGLIGGEKQDCGPWRWCQLRRAGTGSSKQRTLNGGPVLLSVASGLNHLRAASESICVPAARATSTTAVVSSATSKGSWPRRMVGQTSDVGHRPRQ